MIYTPYTLVTSVIGKLGLAMPSKLIKRYLSSSKILLQRLRANYDDVTIAQMVDYTCTGMLRDGVVRTFPMFYTIMTSYLDKNTNIIVERNVTEASLQEQKSIDNK